MANIVNQASTRTASAKATVAKKRRNQLPYAFLVLAGIIVFAFALKGIGPKLPISWMFGIAFGIVLQKSRFCFTASLRDPVLTGSTSLTKAVLIAFAIASVGFAAIQYSAVQAGRPVPGFVSPAGWHVAIGALMFGIGMVISGGCASGTLMRVGEGFMMQWLSLTFFVVGSLWGAHDFSWWKETFMTNAPAIHIPSLIGWPAAIFGQLILLGVLYLVADWFGNRRSNQNS